MRKLLTMTIAGMFTLGAGAALAACSDGETTISTPEGDVSVDPDSGSVDFEGEDGSGSVNVGEGSEVPDDFPSDVPLPDGTLVSSSSFGTDDDKTWGLVYTFDDPGSVLDDYRDALEDAGYEIAGEFNVSNDEGGYSAYTADGDDYTVAVGGGGGIGSGTGSGGDDGGVSITVTTVTNTP